MYIEKSDHRSVINPVMLLSIQCPRIISITKIPRSLGTKVSVCSCMEVTVWNIETARPMINEIRSMGAAVRIIVYSVVLVISTTLSTVNVTFPPPCHN